MDVRRREIKEETKDRIVLTDSVLTIRCVLYGLVLIACGLFFLGIGIGLSAYPGSMGVAEGWGSRILISLFGLILIPFLALILIYFAGSKIIDVLDDLLVKESVIIDGKFQNVIIEGDSVIKDLNYIEKMGFADIKHIEITIEIANGKATGHRDVALIMIDGTTAKIYDGNCETVEKLGKNIRNITGKQISYKNHSYFTSSIG